MVGAADTAGPWKSVQSRDTRPWTLLAAPGAAGTAKAAKGSSTGAGAAATTAGCCGLLLEALTCGAWLALLLEPASSSSNPPSKSVVTLPGAGDGAELAELRMGLGEGDIVRSPGLLPP
jgi:hypothetical protein